MTADIGVIGVQHMNIYLLLYSYIGVCFISRPLPAIEGKSKTNKVHHG